MRIACLQFNPALGKFSENIALANALLQTSTPQDIDLLVLPELAFTGNYLVALPHSFFPTYQLSIY